MLLPETNIHLLNDIAFLWYQLYILTAFYISFRQEYLTFSYWETYLPAIFEHSLPRSADSLKVHFKTHLIYRIFAFSQAHFPQHAFLIAILTQARKAMALMIIFFVFELFAAVAVAFALTSPCGSSWTEYTMAKVHTRYNYNYKNQVK